MEDNRHLWRIAENISNKRVQTIDMGDDTSSTNVCVLYSSVLSFLTCLN